MSMASRHGPCCSASCNCSRPTKLTSLACTYAVAPSTVFITPTPSTLRECAATSHNRRNRSWTSNSAVDISANSPTAQVKASATTAATHPTPRTNLAEHSGYACRVVAAVTGWATASSSLHLTRAYI